MQVPGFRTIASRLPDFQQKSEKDFAGDQAVGVCL